MKQQRFSEVQKKEYLFLKSKIQAGYLGWAECARVEFLNPSQRTWLKRYAKDWSGQWSQPLMDQALEVAVEMMRDEGNRRGY